MNSYKVLVVDDEPHAIEVIVHLLKKMESYDIDIYRARSYEEAVRILQEGRMDLVITDIEMPEKTGLDLVVQIQALWPLCRIIVLTAFAQFQYAYDAIQLHVDGYILKTESDISIMEKIAFQLDEGMRTLDNNARQPLVSAVSHENRELLYILNGIVGGVSAFLSRMGFSENDSGRLYYLLMYSDTATDARMRTIDMLMKHYLGDSVLHRVYAPVTEQISVWMFSSLHGVSEEETLHLSGCLELLQKTCEEAFSLNLSFLLYPADLTGQGNLREGVERLSASIALHPNMPFIYHSVPKSQLQSTTGSISGSNVEWLCSYINEHLEGDVSLVHLSAITGYNPQYLSNLFHQVMGKTISRYISDKRLSLARAMLADASIPINDIAKKLGFSSHSYFSRFIRQETQMSPQKLRIQLLNR